MPEFFYLSYKNIITLVYLIFFCRIIDNWEISSNDISILKRESPTLYGIYVKIISINQNTSQAKEALIKVFTELLNKRKYIYENSVVQSESISESEYEALMQSTGEDISAPSFELMELWKTGFFFQNIRSKEELVI